jgi:hypothetical protein
MSASVHQPAVRPLRLTASIPAVRSTRPTVSRVVVWVAVLVLAVAVLVAVRLAGHPVETVSSCFVEASNHAQSAAPFVISRCLLGS